MDLRRWLLPAAVVGLMIDALISLLLRGGAALRRPGAVAALMFASALCAFPAPQPSRAAEAAPVSERDINSALSARLAYVMTGDASVDEATRLGMTALTRVLSARTSAELAEPIALDPARDELAFYPLVYWPIVADQPQPKSEARTRIAAYMKNGGTIVFDTRDALTTRPDGPPPADSFLLRALLKGVDPP